MGKDIIIITGGANGLGLALVKESIEKGLFIIMKYKKGV